MKLQINDLINTHGHHIEAFLFDLDGTLVDSSKAIINAIKSVLDSKGHFYNSEKNKDDWNSVGRDVSRSHPNIVK